MRPNACYKLVIRVALPLALLAVAGCERQQVPDHYSLLAGKIVACHTDTGELHVRGLRRTEDGPAEYTLYCLITRDSEIYINDRVSSIEDIQIGDAVELVGRRDAVSDADRFIVAFAYFDHPLPAPPRPELAPASAPATQDTMDLEKEDEE